MVAAIDCLGYMTSLTARSVFGFQCRLLWTPAYPVPQGYALTPLTVQCFSPVISIQSSLLRIIARASVGLHLVKL